MSGANEKDAVFFTCDGDPAALSGDFAVSVHPKGRGGFNNKLLCFIGGDPFEAVMFSLEGGGQRKKYEGLWQVADGADIQYAVAVVCVRGKHKAAALKAVEHAGGKEHIAYIGVGIVLKSQFAGNCLRGKKLFQGYPQVGQLSKADFVHEFLEP